MIDCRISYNQRKDSVVARSIRRQQNNGSIIMEMEILATLVRDIFKLKLV